jgi:hypothetical protein
MLLRSGHDEPKRVGDCRLHLLLYCAIGKVQRNVGRGRPKTGLQGGTYQRKRDWPVHAAQRKIPLRPRGATRKVCSHLLK